MRKRLRSMLALLLAAAMVMTLFSGCGRRESSADRSSRRSRSERTSSRDRDSSREDRRRDPTVPEYTEETEYYEEPEESQRQEPVEEAQPTEPRQLVYDDTRVPNYQASNPQWELHRFDWTCHDGRSTAWMEIYIDREMYNHYRNLERYFGIDNYSKYINDANNRKIIQDIVGALRQVAEDLSFDDAAVAREIAKFVQDCIEYQYDTDTTGEDEYPRYPIETIFERRGDCEDTSILMAALLKEWGYDVGFLHLPGHLAVALRTTDDYSGGSYYEIDGHRYLFIESTGSGWNIGDIPEEYRSVSAEFHRIP